MKKYVLLIIGLIIILPFKIKAMHDYDYSLSYDAIVTNPNGARIYDTVDAEEDNEDIDMVLKQIGTIPYNAKITIEQEEYDYFEGYGEGSSIGIDSALGDYTKIIVASAVYKGKSIDVNVADIKPIKLKYTVEDLDPIYDENQNILVINDVIVRKEPSETSESIGITIKKGEIIKDYKVVYNSKESLTDWAYIEYNEVKGYINTYNNGPKGNNTKTKFKINNAIKIENGSIPVNTTLELVLYDFYYNNGFVKYALYEGEVVEFFRNTIVEEEKNTLTVKVLKDVKLYKESEYTENEKNHKVVTTLKKGDKFSTNYYSDSMFSGGVHIGNCYFYYEKGEIKGWIEIEDTKNNCFYNYDTQKNIGRVYSLIEYSYKTPLKGNIYEYDKDFDYDDDDDDYDDDYDDEDDYDDDYDDDESNTESNDDSIIVKPKETPVKNIYLERIKENIKNLKYCFIAVIAIVGLLIFSIIRRKKIKKENK